MCRKICVFLFILLLWFISSVIFPVNVGYYLSLNVPKFIIPSFLIMIIWILIYFCNTYSMFILIKDYEPNNNYYFYLLINYLTHQLIHLFFFIFNNLIFTLLIILLCTLSALFLFLEVKRINNKLSLLLIPNFIFSLYLSIIYIGIFILN